MSFSRVSEWQVTDLLNAYREANPPTNLQFALDAGHLLVESHLGEGRTDMTEEELTQVELWCCAHFAMGTRSDLVAQETGDSSETFARSAPKMGMTKYLAQAILLDRSGMLSRAQDAQAVVRLISR